MNLSTVRYFVAATTGQAIPAVFYGNQPDTPDICTSIFQSGPPDISQHKATLIAKYRATIRSAIIDDVTDEATAEALAQALLDRVRILTGRNTYYGVYLTANIAVDAASPVTFAPDNGSGTARATTFTVNDYVLIGTEVLKVTVVATPNVTATRAQLGTAAQAHTNNDPVYNITQDPVPGKRCDSTFAEFGVLDVGIDDKRRREYDVLWEVRLK